MEETAASVLSPWLAQLGIFGLGLVVIGFFVWLWLRESRAIRGETATALDRKDDEIADLKKELTDAKDRERATYDQLMACRYPERGSG